MADIERLQRALRNAHNAGDTQAARRIAGMIRAQREQAPQDEGDAGTFERLATQAGVGSQFGIANVLGLPVDAVASALSGLGEATGLYGPIEAPVGGSEFFSSIMEPLRRNVAEPTTRGERIARRVGEEVGAAAAGLPLAFASPAVRAAPAASAAVEGAAAVGGGLGAGLLGEFFPDSQAADIAGAVLGGLTAGGAASRATGLGGTGAVVRPGVEDQRAIAARAYQQVRDDPRLLPQDVTQSLGDRVATRMADENINARLQPNAAKIMEAITTDTQNPLRIEDIEQLRRVTTQSMPATASPSDRRLGQIMKQEVTDFLDELDDPIADLLREGRAATRRASVARDVAAATDRAALRAASTGSGGNEINAIRQNLRRILDSPRLSSSFTADELSAIREIVEGSTDQNLLRRLSRIAPTSGGLAAMLGIGGTLASPEVALPIMGIAEAARFAGERSTQRSIQDLLQQLAPDKVLRPSEQGATDALRGLLSLRTLAGQGE